MNKIRIAQIWGTGIVIALLAVAAILPLNSASVAKADKPLNSASPAVTPAPPDKNGTQLKESSTNQGAATTTLPEPWSKNGDARVPNSDSPGETRAYSPEPGSKNDRSDAQSKAPADPGAVLAAGGSLITCGASGNMNWTTTSNTFQVIRQCTLSVPQAGWVFISTNGSLARQDGEFEAQFEIGIDSTSGDADIDRWVNVYNDTGDGTDESVALSVLKPITAGTHTFYSLGKRYTGAGTVLVYDPTLTVIFIPSSNSQLLPCGASGNTNWTTTSNTFQVIRQCTLSVPRAGWVFISADGSLARSDGEYEGQFEIGIDTTSGDADIDRWVNVYNDTGDGTDRSVALSVLKPISAGAHTFYSLGKRYSGTSTMLVYDPTLTVIYVPAPNATALTCGASGNTNWTTTSNTFQVIRQCTLSVPQAGWAFISADGSLARWDGEYEGQFEIGIDTTSGDADIDRWVNVYNDTGDGTDKSVALSVLKPISAGTHTFYFLGKRYTGAGTVLVYDPTLTIIAPGASSYLPILIRSQ